MKYLHGGPFWSVRRSPSMRREWIEILSCVASWIKKSGSPSMRREWIEMFCTGFVEVADKASPSMRREWIEIKAAIQFLIAPVVSLHAEGVD